MNPENINVGNLGTKPVLKYSINTGIPNIRDISKNNNPNILKNIVGLYSLNNLAIVLSTLNPSENVLSLDIEPSGLSL